MVYRKPDGGVAEFGEIRSDPGQSGWSVRVTHWQSFSERVDKLETSQRPNDLYTVDPMHTQ